VNGDSFKASDYIWAAARMRATARYSGLADRIRFQGRRMGRDIAGRQVRRARAAAGLPPVRPTSFAKSWRRENRAHHI
jgi:hypothetical protein